MSDAHVLGREIVDIYRNTEGNRVGGINNSNNCDLVNRANPSSSEVQHLRDLSNDLDDLFQSGRHSDVTFTLDDGQKIQAHRLILAARSRYFQALLYNGMKESEEKEISLKDTNSTAFTQILRYAYTSKIKFSGVEMDILLEILSLAHRYDMNPLVKSIGDFFKDNLKIENLCNIFNAAQFYAQNDLIEYCLVYADKYAPQLLLYPDFVLLSADCLSLLLKRDSFYASELDIFNAVKKWAEHNSDEKSAIESLLDLVRLPLIPQADLLESVRPSKLVTAEDLLDAISVQTQKLAVQFRGMKVSDVNIATLFHGASVVACENENGSKLFSEELSEDQRLAIHCNPRQSGSKMGIVVDLGRPYIINQIIIDLCTKSEQHLYSYILEISMDKDSELSWLCVANYSNYYCQRRQKIYFEDTVCQFIRIRCAEQCSKLIVKRIEATWSKESMHVDKATGLIVPNKNIATIENHALVVEGVSRCRNALINGEISNYDWDSGYTCHQIGSGAIIIELPQPYLLSSIRLLLWNCDDRFYSYYVAVSTNQIDWLTVVDKTEEECRGWQTLIFDPVPVIFIKLVGTHNSSNLVFHVVHLEAPASVTYSSENCTL